MFLSKQRRGTTVTQHVETAAEALVYTVDEAASVLRIGRNAIYEEISAGRLKSFTQGRRRRIARADLVAFVNALRKDAEPKPARAPICRTAPRVKE